MGEKDNKISTVVLKVDLECQRCYKKIRRVLCKIQDKMDIKTISYDEKSNTVTISGPFDADKVCGKLCCHAGRVIKDMNVKGKDSKDGGEKAAAAKPAEKEKAKEGKADSKEGKGEKAKEGKAEEAKPPGKEKKDDKAAEPKKVKFDVPPKADIGPLLEKMKASMAKAEPPCGEPVTPPAAAQGVAVPAHSIWPAPATSVAGYSYIPSYDPSYYGGGGGGGYGYSCGCGGYGGAYCRCGKAAAAPPAPAGGGYYGVPVYDNQGWYYGGGGRQPYYPQQQQQSCCEDPNGGCSVM